MLVHLLFQRLLSIPVLGTKKSGAVRYAAGLFVLIWSQTD